MSESKSTPVKRKLIFGFVAAAAIVLVLSAIGLYALVIDPNLVDQIRSAVSESEPRDTRDRERDGSTGRNRDAEPPQSVPVAQGEPVNAVDMIDIVAMPRIVSFDGVGESQQLTVQGFYSDGSIGEPVELPGIQPTFTSSEPGMVRVSSDGVVAALEVGGADILVRYGEHATEVPVLVWPPDRPIPAPDFSKLVEVDDDGTAVLVNRVLAELEPGYGDADAAELAAMLNGQMIFQYLTFPGYIIEFESSGMADLESALEVLHADGRIARAYPDHTVSASQTPTPPESVINTKTQGFSEVGMYKAWDLLNQKKLYYDRPYYDPVVIVVIDTYFPPETTPLPKAEDGCHQYGSDFDYKRIEVSNSMEDVPKMDGVDGLKGPGHGIPVTSILVAQNNSASPIGLCKSLSLSMTVDSDGLSGVVTSVDGLPYLLKFYGYDHKRDPFRLRPRPKVGEFLQPEVLGLLSQVLDSLDHIHPIRQQVDVVNLSFRMPCSSLYCGSDDTWSGLMRDMGHITFVIGAGNDNTDISDENIIPASFTVDRGDRDAVPNVITVGGTVGGKKHAGSNYGEAITIAAPYTVTAVVADNSVNDSIDRTLKGNTTVKYEPVPGTSFSAPLVTGTVALMKSLDPKLTPEQIIAILKATGTDTDWCRPLPPGTKCTPDESIKLLDAEGAVQAVLNSLPTNALVQLRNQLSTAQAVLPTPTPTPIIPGSLLWKHEVKDVPGPIPGSSAAYVNLGLVEDGVAYVQVSDLDGLVFLEVVDSTTGNHLQRYRPDGRDAAIVHGVVYEERGGYLAAVDAATGEERWRYEETEGTVSLRDVVDGVVYVKSDVGLDAVDAEYGKQLKRYDPHGSLRGVSDGVLYVESHEALAVVDAATGEEISRYPKEGLAGERVGMIVDGVIYIEAAPLVIMGSGLSHAASLAAVDAATGEEIWRIDDLSGARSGFQIRSVVDGMVYADINGGVDATNGKEHWRYRPPNGSAYFEAVADGVAYVGKVESFTLTKVEALDAATGEWLWNHRYGRVYPGAGGLVYVLSGDRDLDAMDVATGKVRWSYSSPGRRDIRFDVADGVVYIVSLDNTGAAVTYVDAVDAATGSTLWSYQIRFISLSNSIKVVDGVVYVAGGRTIARNDGAGESFDFFLHAIQR